MPLALQELVKLIEHFGYQVNAPPQGEKKTSVVDELLGAFEDAVPAGQTSTEYVKKLRESGYGRY